MLINTPANGFRIVQGLDVNNVEVPLRIDTETNSAVVHDHVQHAVNQGWAFHYSAKIQLAIGATGYFLGRVGVVPCHFHGYSITGDDGPVDILFYEAPTITAPGTLVTPRNKRRYPPTADPAMLIYLNPTVTVDGTLLKTLGILASAAGSHTVESIAADRSEWLLNTSTDYIFKIINNSGVTLNLIADFSWLEIPL